MLWFMRRPRIKRMRRRSWEMWQEPMRSRVRNHVVGQDRWALKHGLKIVNAITSFLLGCILVYTVMAISLWLIESGALTMPDAIRDRAERVNGIH